MVILTFFVLFLFQNRMSLLSLSLSKGALCFSICTSFAFVFSLHHRCADLQSIEAWGSVARVYVLLPDMPEDNYNRFVCPPPRDGHEGLDGVG